MEKIKFNPKEPIFFAAVIHTQFRHIQAIYDFLATFPDTKICYVHKSSHYLRIVDDPGQTLQKTPLNTIEDFTHEKN